MSQTTESQFRYSGILNNCAIHGFTQAVGVFQAIQTIARTHKTVPNNFTNMSVWKIRDSKGVACSLLVAKWPVKNLTGEDKWKIAVSGEVDITSDKNGVVLPFTRVGMPKKDEPPPAQRSMGPAPPPVSTISESAPSKPENTPEFLKDFLPADVGSNAVEEMR